MKLTLYQVDAFTDAVFAGNPAAVCLLQEWLPDIIMQQIAMENNLAETAFVVPSGDEFLIRWFTPAVEVNLCGHATLASAFVLFECEGYAGETIRFRSVRSGLLPVTREGNLLTLDFPADPHTPIEVNENISACFGLTPMEAWKGKTDLLLVFGSEEEIRNMIPDFITISRLEARGIIVTAQGKQVDFVSRFFAPRVGVPEDPVTGSAHTMLIPFWAKRLGRQTLRAKQLSARGGDLYCKLMGDRVAISGNAALYLTGEINIPETI
jgi:PhzF family phenazine biosynthesis protein